MKEQLINPITIIKPGQCPHCLSTLIVDELEELTIKITEDGLPIRFDVYNFECKLACPNCLAEFDADKIGIFYIRKSKYNNFIKENTYTTIRNPFGHIE
jgi:hypothetical protein